MKSYRLDSMPSTAVAYDREMVQCCTKCGSRGPFPKDKKRPNGLHTQCKECHKRRIAERRAADPEAARETWRRHARVYRHRNPDIVRARYTRWRERNIDKVHEYSRAISRSWYRSHKERWLIYKFRRRAAQVNAPGAATVAQIQARIDFFGGCCAYCRGPFEHVDHVIALSRGGSNWPANLRPACSACNLKKHVKVWQRVLL